MCLSNPWLHGVDYIYIYLEYVNYASWFSDHRCFGLHNKFYIQGIWVCTLDVFEIKLGTELWDIFEGSYNVSRFLEVSILKKI